PRPDSAVHRHSLGRAGRCRPSARHGELPAARLCLDLLRGEPHADAVGGTVDTARWQRARRSRGQPVSLERGLREQRAARREGAHHHRGHGGTDPHPGTGARAAAALLNVAGIPIFGTQGPPEWIAYNGHLPETICRLTSDRATTTTTAPRRPHSS